MKNILSVFFLILCFCSTSQSGEKFFVPGKVIIKFKEVVELDETYTAASFDQSSTVSQIPHSVEKILTDKKYKSLKRLIGVKNADRSSKSRDNGDREGSSIYLLDFDEKEDPKQVAVLLNQDPNVEYAEPEYYFYGLFEPDDEKISEQWYLEKIQAFDAWDQSTGSGEVIAILDTGVDPDHPDLKDKVLPGYDFINDDNDPRDDNMHGTHVAGIAAAATDNSEGIAGVAPNAMILPVKVLGSNGVGSTSSIIQGIQFAVNEGATVINMSFGNSTESLALKDILSEAYASSTW